MGGVNRKTIEINVKSLNFNKILLQVSPLIEEAKRDKFRFTELGSDWIKETRAEEEIN